MPTIQTVLTTQTPAAPNVTDNVAYELGMKFRSAKAGNIVGIRFWKAASEPAGHVGTIWSSDGTPMTQVNFGAETSSSWQYQDLPTPLAIQANVTYIVSVTTSGYFAVTGGAFANVIANGDLSSVADGANGVFGPVGMFPNNTYNNSNYFRDVQFVVEQIATITKASGDNQTGTTGTTLPTALTVQIKDADGNPQPGTTVSFTVSTGGGSVNPSQAVTNSNGLAGAALTLGNMAGTNTVRADAGTIGNVDFTANATAPASPGQSLFTTQVPVLPDAADGTSYELGMKFSALRNGQIRAIRYWKSPSDTGTHAGKLWSATGTLLGSVSFTGETASGWQQQTLPTPIPIDPNIVYVVSVNIGSYYPFTNGGLANPIANGDLSSISDGANGVYGATGTFPVGSYQNSNYFRDVVFVPDTASSIVKVSGDNQVGAPGATLPNPLVVSLKDSANQPVFNAIVNFSVTMGSASVSPSSTTTDVDGIASTSLTLGSTPGDISISATAPGVGTVVFNAAVGNPIYEENQKLGTSAWQLTNPVTATAPEIAGYAAATSVNVGGTLPLKISLATAGQYTIEIYRLGFYNGTGGRLVASIGPLNGVTQAACVVTEATTRLIECPWSVSHNLAIGADWVTGFYVAKLIHSASGKQSYIWFVVRDDSSHSDIVFQSGFTTFQAYNQYGTSTERRSLYSFNSTNGQAAQKVSFDRPFAQVTIDPSHYNNPLSYEYNMIRWIESQGYDVSYITNMDVHTNSASLQQHKVYLSVGHDEYWSLEMRNGVEQARDAGINLGFFSANTAYWRVRFAQSSTGVPDRVMACYKFPSEFPDPVAPTYRWRDAQNDRPENALIGIMYTGDDSYQRFGGFDFVVTNSSDPYYANTGLANGNALTKLVGYEWDGVVNNGFSPSGLVTLSASPVTPTEIAPDLPPGTNTTISNAARYTAASGAKVFATGSIQWMWGLDSFGVSPPRVDIRAQQFAVNVLASMGAKPATPSAGIVVPP